MWVVVGVTVRGSVHVDSFVRDGGSADPTRSGLGTPVEALEPEVCHSVSDKRINFSTRDSVGGVVGDAGGGGAQPLSRKVDDWYHRFFIAELGATGSTHDRSTV